MRRAILAAILAWASAAAAAGDVAPVETKEVEIEDVPPAPDKPAGRPEPSTAGHTGPSTAEPSTAGHLEPPTARPTAGTASEGAPRRPPAISAAPQLSGLTDEHVPMPPMHIPQAQPEPDRRPAYVGAGIVVMALALWWSRRQRDRFDREDDRRHRRDRPRDAERDADADDLHAAARGDSRTDHQDA